MTVVSPGYLVNLEDARRACSDPGDARLSNNVGYEIYLALEFLYYYCLTTIHIRPPPSLALYQISELNYQPSAQKPPSQHH